MNEKESSESKTDWTRLKEMTDEEVDTSDIPPLEESFFKNAKLRMPKNKVANKISLDTKSKSL